MNHLWKHGRATKQDTKLQNDNANINRRVSVWVNHQA